MIVKEPGHVYVLDWFDLDWPGEERPDGDEDTLIFVNREDNPHPGTQTQEVIRALIDRTMHCDNCLRWTGNDLIIYHLRMALVLHEARALGRKVEKGELSPENVALGHDGHFDLSLRPTISEDAQAYLSKEK